MLGEHHTTSFTHLLIESRNLSGSLHLWWRGFRAIGSIDGLCKLQPSVFHRAKHLLKLQSKVSYINGMVLKVPEVRSQPDRCIHVCHTPRHLANKRWVHRIEAISKQTHGSWVKSIQLVENGSKLLSLQHSSSHLSNGHCQMVVLDSERSLRPLQKCMSAPLGRLSSYTLRSNPHIERDTASKGSRNGRPSTPVNDAALAQQPALAHTIQNVHSLIPLWIGRHSAMRPRARAARPQGVR